MRILLLHLLGIRAGFGACCSSAAGDFGRCDFDQRLVERVVLGAGPCAVVHALVVLVGTWAVQFHFDPARAPAQLFQARAH